MIPRHTHQIWIGPNPMPLKWMDTWRKKNPDMDYSLWTGYQGFRYENKIQALVDEERYASAADIMRVEILAENGGVFLDADSMCVHPIQDAPFMDSQFFAVRDYTGWIANGVMGCTPNHPVMREYLERIDGGENYWDYGARMLTAVLQGKDVVILPTYSFYPRNWNRSLAEVDGIKYAEQMWLSTRGNYERARS